MLAVQFAFQKLYGKGHVPLVFQDEDGNVFVEFSRDSTHQNAPIEETVTVNV